MVAEISLDILKGIGMFFLHPLVYIAFLFMIFIGVKRVKRERENFNTRVFDVIEDVVNPLLPSILAGLGVTILLVAGGLVFPFEWLVLVAAVYILLSCTLQPRLASPSFAIGISILLAITLTYVEIGITFIDVLSTQVDAIVLRNAVILLVVLVIVEGLLIRYKGGKRTSPRLLESKRGKLMGSHESKKLWVVPVGFFLPNGVIPSYEAWPLLTVGGEEGFSFILVPFLIGFQQLVRSTLPHEQIEKVGLRVVGFGILLSAFAIGSSFYSWLIPITAVIAIVGREALTAFHRVREESQQSCFSLRENGLVILGIIPRSPAEKMSLQVGEVIMKVNGIPVTNEYNFYEALQKNSAFCKLDVVDSAGEVRFAQTALYDGEHHQIGVLFTKEDYVLQDSVV
ncbi:PDZ domain-containing protein [Bacillus sp. FJAT-45350]|uniref:PDZ domain-containing protein n=1 Tax=Bacillus sp. FJAT-45350 TaxID=2011014 RepID=UPI000BB97F5E|nr:PDZ domain-containing protein [Bacillus sp. FJAT-45350]